MNLLGVLLRKEGLANRPDPLELVKDQTDRFLDAPFGIRLDPMVLGLREADGAITISSPRVAIARRASSERWRKRSSSYSFRLPLSPSNNRSLLARGAYTVS